MRHILLDESVPVGLAAALMSSGCKVSRVVEIGLGGISDRQLVALARDLDADVLLTCDQHMAEQQNLRNIPFAVVVICTNNWPTIRTNAAHIVEAVARIQTGACNRILQHAHRTRYKRRAKSTDPDR